MNNIGIDIGGTNTRIALGNQKGEIFKLIQFDTPQNPQEFLKTLNQKIAQLNPEDKKFSIGICAPGIIDSKTKTIIKSPNLYQWKNFPLGKILARKYKVKTAIENDADLAALAEATLGKGKGKKTILYVGLGTGIGVGVVSNKKIYKGSFGMEGGHIILHPQGILCGCGAYGCFESYVSGRAIQQRFGKEAKFLNDKKDWDKIAQELAWGLSTLTVCFTPNIIVLGGGVLEAKEKFWKPMQTNFKKLVRIVPQPQITESKFKISPGLIGALFIA